MKNEGNKCQIKNRANKTYRKEKGRGRGFFFRGFVPPPPPHFYFSFFFCRFPFPFCRFSVLFFTHSSYCCAFFSFIFLFFFHSFVSCLFFLVFSCTRYLQRDVLPVPGGPWRRTTRFQEMTFGSTPLSYRRWWCCSNESDNHNTNTNKMLVMVLMTMVVVVVMVRWYWWW